MRDIINSLSLGSGALVVAIISGLMAVGLSRIKSKKIVWVTGIIVPFLIAHLLYWAPIYFYGSNPSEYSSWSGIFITPWYAAGLIISILVFFITRKLKINELN